MCTIGKEGTALQMGTQSSSAGCPGFLCMRIPEGLGGQSSMCVAGREQCQVLGAYQEKTTFFDCQAGGTAAVLHPCPALAPRGCRGPSSRPHITSVWMSCLLPLRPRP